MFSALIYIFIVGSFIHLDGCNIIKNTAIVNYNRFRRINNLVSTNYDGFFNIMWISSCMVIEALLVSFIQYMNKTVVQIDGSKNYIVTYVIKGKTYKMLVKPSRGPRKVLLISNNNNKDISYDICPYLGPDECLHGIEYTPNFFNQNEMIFQMSNGEEKIFKNNDKIILTI